MKDYLPTSETRGLLIFTSQDDPSRKYIRDRFYSSPFRACSVKDTSTVQRIVEDRAEFARKVFSAEGLKHFLQQSHGLLIFIAQDPNEHYFLNNEGEAFTFLEQAE